MIYTYIPRTILVLILFFLGSRIAGAEDPRFLSAYHSEYALKLYSEDKIDLALERFVKAIILDPKNKTAKESLNKIAAREPASSHSLKILRLVDQIEYLDFLNSRIESLVLENTRLKEYLKTNKALMDNPELLEKYNHAVSAVEQKASALPQVGLIGFAQQDDQAFDLDSVIHELNKDRESFAKEVKFWEDRNVEFRALRKTAINVNEVAYASANQYKTQLTEAARRAEEKDELLGVQQQNIEFFKNELAAVRDSFNSLQEKFNDTGARITELTNKIAAMSVEILEKDKKIGEVQEHAAELEHELAVAQEKMNLSQKIIQEKDERLTNKEQLADKYKEAFLTTNDKANQLIGMVEIYRGKLIEARQALSEKETQFNEVQDKLFSRDLSFYQK